MCTITKCSGVCLLTEAWTAHDMDLSLHNRMVYIPTASLYTRVLHMPYNALSVCAKVLSRAREPLKAWAAHALLVLYMQMLVVINQ